MLDLMWIKFLAMNLPEAYTYLWSALYLPICMMQTRRAVMEKKVVFQFLWQSSSLRNQPEHTGNPMAPLLLGSGGGRRGKGCSQRGVERGCSASHRGCHHGDLASECCGQRPGLQKKRSEPEAAAREAANTTTQQSVSRAVWLQAPSRSHVSVCADKWWLSKKKKSTEALLHVTPSQPFCGSLHLPCVGV